MAINRHPIDQKRILAGRRILDMIDSVGFDAFAAGWINDRPTQTWKYLLSTPMLKSKGPLWVYERLLRMFRHMPLPDGISPLDIYVVDPDLEMALFGDMVMGAEVLFNGKRQMPPCLIIGITQDIQMEGLSVTDGFVHFYRRLAHGDRKKHKDPARTFDRKVRMLEAA